MTDAPPHAPLCASPDFKPRKPALKLPKGACDSHAHICGPIADFDYSPERIYTPPDCLLSDYSQMLSTLGVSKAVLVQPSIYGTDNTVMLKAMAEATIPIRGVAVVDGLISDNELANMHQAGVRGVRYNIVDVADPSGDIPLDDIKAMAERIKFMGWHVEFLIHTDDYANFDKIFSDFPTDIVVGHLGYMRPGQDTTIPGFQALLRLMQAGKCWTKLTGPYRISSGDVPYADTVPFAHALMEAAPDQVIWGTDWPHVMVKKPMPNDGDICDLLADWVPDAENLKRVLVDNPNRLYDLS